MAATPLNGDEVRFKGEHFPRKMDVNDVLVKYVGSFGRYQKWQCFMLGMLGFVIGFYAYDIVFAAAIPDHWCTIPDSNTTDSAHLSSEELKELFIPKEEKNGELVLSSCLLYDDIGFKNGSNEERKTKKCSKWTYDRSVYKSTIVTEWNLVCDKTALVATAQSFLMVGKLVGVLTSGLFSDRFGRRKVILAAMMIMIPVRLMIAFAVNYTMYVVAYTLSGAFTLYIYLVSFVLMVELVGSEWRAFVGILSAFLWGIALIALGGVAYMIREWVTLTLVLSTPILSVFLYFIFMPESPRWLFSRGRTEEGIALLQKMAKVNKKDIPEEVIEKLRSNRTENKHKNETTENLWDLVKNRVLIIRTLIVSVGWWNVNIGYVGLMLNTTNLSGSPFLNLSIGGLMESIGYFAAQFFMDRKLLGRRNMLSLTLVLGGVSLLVAMPVPEDKKIVVTILAQFGKLLFSAAFVIIYVLTAEMFPSTVRNSGLSMCATTGKTASLISPYIIHLGTINRMTPLIIIGTLGVFSGLLMLLLPETRGKELHQTIGDHRRSGDRFFWWRRKTNENSVDDSKNSASSNLLHEMKESKRSAEIVTA